MKNLSGKNAILTGGSSGIGPYIARALATEGVNIALVARTKGLLESVSKNLSDFSSRVITVPADITDVSDRIKIINTVNEEFGQIDILINNAAICHIAPFVRQGEKQISGMIETNFTAPVLFTLEILKGMLDRGSGHVINISSLAGKKGTPYEAVYSGSKAALIEWGNALRLETEDSGVGVSAICPVFISKVGMFAKFGISCPKLIGIVSPESVAKATIKAIKKNQQEVLVRPSPTRPLYALNALSPGLGNLAIKLIGLVKLQRKLAYKEEQMEDAAKELGN